MCGIYVDLYLVCVYIYVRIIGTYIIDTYPVKEFDIHVFYLVLYI